MDETAVFVPAYTTRPPAPNPRIDCETGSTRLFCRRLNDDTVTFVHDDPAPLLPETT